MSKRDPLTTNVIACKWRRTSAGWELWVKGRPEVCGCGPTCEAAQDALIDAVMGAAPDLDAVIPVVPEFDPPLPAPAFAQPYLVPELYLIRGDEIFELHQPAPAEDGSEDGPRAYVPSLFTEGICRACNHGRGGRTQVPLRLDYAPPRVDAGWLRAPFYAGIHVFSGRFIELLTPPERARLDFRRIEMPLRSRRPFYELGGHAEVPFVGVRGLEADGLECTACGHRDLSVVDPRLMDCGQRLRQFICGADLPKPLIGCFTVGCGHEVELCVSRERWEALRDHPHARGLTSRPVGVVAEADCERRPRIRNRREHCETCAQWPEPLTIDNKQRASFDLPTDMCSRRNFTWFAEAERLGYIQRSRVTMEPDAMWKLVASGQAPRTTEFMSFRCPDCWRLGWVILTSTELSLA